MGFPLDSYTAAPSYYVTIPSLATKNNVFYVGDTVTITISQATPTTWTVYDYFGNQVSTGTVSGTTVNLGSSFNPGWYRVRFTGASTDPTYGPSYGATTFVVLRHNSNFQTMPAYGTAGNGAAGQHSNPPDYVFRGVMGIAPPRMEMSASVLSDTTGNDSVAVMALDAPYAQNWWVNPSAPYFDPDRPRYCECSISSRSWDKLDLNNASAQVCATAYPTDAHAADANDVFITIAAGSSSGFKVQISYPNSSTVVETYDNLASTDAAATAINGISAYIRWTVLLSANTPSNIAATAIGNVYYLGTKYISQTLVPLGILYFEGPTNEPGINDITVATDKMRLFAKAIRDGDSRAKVLGPCPVDIVNNWSAFFSNGGASHVDYISFHDYNTFLDWGDIMLARNQIESFLAIKNKYAPQVPLWQTEATSAQVVIGGGASSMGLYQPRVAANVLMNMLIWEQYGLPRERNTYWYDYSHGFWSVPVFMMTGDNCPSPVTVLIRVLAEETFGKPFAYRVDMGCEALNKICIGSVYKAHGNTFSPSIALFQLASHIPGAKLTLSINGTTSALTVVDAFGNTSTVTPSAGRVQISVDDVPTYLELPAGVTCSVYSFYDGAYDWGNTPNPSISRAATTHTLGGVATTVICDDQWLSAWGAYPSATGLVYSSIVVPDTAELLFPSTIAIDRVVIFNGPPRQAMSGLLTFTVDTTANGGTTWTTQTTVDISAQSVSTQFGTTGNNAGCDYETFATMQHIFPVSFASPVSCNGVRVSISKTTYGGSPDQQSYDTNSAGVNEQRVSLEEIMVISASTPTNSVSAPANTTIPYINGTPRLGQVVSCNPGVWTNFPTKYAYQWQRDGTNIVSATAAEYVVTTTDIGHVLTCAVTASNLGGSASATSGSAPIPAQRMTA